MESVSHWEILAFAEQFTRLPHRGQGVAVGKAFAGSKKEGRCGAGDIRGHVGNLYLPLGFAVNPALLWNLKVC